MDVGKCADQSKCAQMHITQFTKTLVDSNPGVSGARRGKYIVIFNVVSSGHQLVMLGKI